MLWGLCLIVVVTSIGFFNNQKMDYNGIKSYLVMDLQKKADDPDEKNHKGYKNR